MSYEEIQRLHEQHQEGALTKAEFEAAKKKLLDARTPAPVQQMRLFSKETEQRIDNSKRMKGKTKVITGLVSAIIIIIFLICWLIYRH